MAGKQVQLQRFSSFGPWVTIKRVTLDLNSRARFRGRAPVGANRLRIAIVRGPGRCGSISQDSVGIVYRRVG